MSELLPSLLPQNLGYIQSLSLRDFTFARIGLKKSGISISIKEVLAFRAAHASARDAIFTPFLPAEIKRKLEEVDIPFIEVHSLAGSRENYLQRPDLGRILNNESEELIKKGNNFESQPDVVIIVSDGLSPLAVNEHAPYLVKELHSRLLQAGYIIAPVILLNQGRVAAADHIGELLNAKLSLILIGERPGLSSPDSLGAYFTYNPKTGLTDESRNCVSNIRPKGLILKMAADKLFYLIQASLTKRLSGVNLKDESSGERLINRRAEE